MKEVGSSLFFEDRIEFDRWVSYYKSNYSHGGISRSYEGYYWFLVGNISCYVPLDEQISLFLRFKYLVSESIGILKFLFNFIFKMLRVTFSAVILIFVLSVIYLTFKGEIFYYFFNLIHKHHM